MGDTVRAEQLLHEVMGVKGDDALLPLPILVNLHRKQLTAPLERLLKQLGGRKQQHPTLRVDRALERVNTRWPALHDGEIFSNDPLMKQLQDQLPETDFWGGDSAIKRVVRNPSPTLANLLLQDYEWLNCEPVLLLHELTWTDTRAEQIAVMIKLLQRELELDPAVEDMIRTYAFK